MVFSFLFVWAVYSPGGFHYGSKCNNTGIGSLYVDFCTMLVLATINHCLGFRHYLGPVDGNFAGL